MKIVATICLFCFVTLSGLMAQEPLPNQLTKSEESRVWEYCYPPAGPEKILVPNPPPGPVRTMGEWEEIQALVIAWKEYEDILVEIIRHAVEETKVIVLAQTPSAVTNRLTMENISLDNVIVLQRNTNSIWIRDYGPWAVYQNEVDSL
ncbi:MAG: agmatine deiminase family protein, partial [Saprospiraceae bacterium]|nr:agmatine deiminase family protein [Saprospiraceae bacterium]